jgi:hypothetical protein
MAFGQLVGAIGPDKPPATMPDLTLVFDPTEVWPDPESCPDWPLVPMEDRRGVRIAGERAAMERLEAIARRLSRSEHLRPPTAEERKTLRGRFFRDFEPDHLGPWRGLGLPGVSWKNHVEEDAAKQIIEGLHIRGYLRKLKAQAAAAEGRAEAAKLAPHEARLARYPAVVADLQGQLKALSEAAARHQQRLDDEVAWGKANDVRQAIRGAHDEAKRAAQALGRAPPPAPTF